MAASSAGRTWTRRRFELRKLNLSPKPNETGGLDSSLKRNTAFVKRLRTSLHSVDALDQILKETASLALDKFLQEIIAACVEGIQRAKTSPEIYNAVEVLSALHQRFAASFLPFTIQLLALLRPPTKSSLVSLNPDIRDRDEIARIAKQRPLLRLLGELELTGIIAGENGKGRTAGQETLACLRDLACITSDKEHLDIVAPLAIGFVKNLGGCFLPHPTLSTATPTEAAILEDQDALLSVDVQQSFLKLLTTFHTSLSNRAQKEHLNLLRTEHNNNEAYIRSGEIFEDRQANYEKQSKASERLWTSVISLSEALSLPIPEQPVLMTTDGPAALVSSNAIASSLVTDGNEYTATSLWADEEERRFYTNIIDLKDEVPPALLVGTTKQSKADLESLGDAEKSLEADVGKIDGRIKDETLDSNVEDTRQNSALAALEAATEPMATAPAIRLTELCSRLPESTSQDAIDRIAVDFAFLNSKAARNRLIKFLADVPKNRLDVLPFYARLIATLGLYMPDIPAGILSVVEDDFRYLRRRKQLELRDTRSKTLHYLAELAKFGLVPAHSILHAFKVFVDDLSRFNIDSLCVLLENCGRYVLRQPSTSQPMTTIVETLMRKKSAQDLSANEVAMLESAYYQAVPPERPAVEPKQRSTMHLFLHHVVYHTLTRTTYDQTYKILRKLSWADPEVRHRLFNVFTKIWKAKFGNISLFALLLYDLSNFHPDFAQQVADQVLEDIRTGMERNNFRDNQQRIASIRYLGELYNFQSVDARMVLDTLWLMVTFGHAESKPMPDRPSGIDAPDDWFRVRMICTLLDITVAHLDHGSNRGRLDAFLTFFQLYLTCKVSAPLDVEFMLQDTLEALRPNLKLITTFEEAAAAVDALKHVDDTYASDVSSDVDMGSEDTESLEEDEDVDQSDHDLQDELADEDGGMSSSDEEVAVVSPIRHRMTEEEEEDFSRDFNRMMSEAAAERARTSRSALADVSLPNIRREKNSGIGTLDANHMLFTVLTKKGSKPQAKSLEVPLGATIAQQSMSLQEQGRLEQQQVKKLVLQQEARRQDEQTAAEKQAMHDALSRKGIRLRDTR